MIAAPVRLRQRPARRLIDGDAEILVGGRGRSFRPELELRRWDSQYVRVRLLHDEEGVVTLDQQAIVWTAPSIEARWYRLPDQRFEFATVFYGAVPPVVRFAVETSPDVDITRQDPLERLAADGSTWGLNQWGGVRRRPADVADSFACYVPWSGDYTRAGGWNYQSGKVAHLFRPWIIDAVGQRAWCAVSLDAGVLTIQIPAAFRESALGPCLLDPTFGYSGTAATDDNVGGAHVLCKALTAPASNGSLDSITIKGRIRGNVGGDPTHSPAIYSDSAGTPGSKLAAVDTAGTAYGNLAGASAEVLTSITFGSLVSGTQYWIGTRQGAAPAGVFSAVIDAWFSFDASGGANFGFKNSASETAWEANGSGYTPISNEKVYIFGSFTSSGASFIARPLEVQGQAVKRASFY